MVWIYKQTAGNHLFVAPNSRIEVIQNESNKSKDDKDNDHTSPVHEKIYTNTDAFLIHIL